MNSRERVITALNHQQPDRVPFDLGATAITGIHGLALHRLREAKKLPHKVIKFHEIFQQLGLIEPDDAKALHIDTFGLVSYTNFCGVKHTDWKEYDNPFGFPALCPKDFFYTLDEATGRRYAYPQGDKTAAPSMMMPAGGYFFDNIDRSPDTVDSDDLDPVRDYKDTYGIMSDEEARFYEKQANYLYENTDLALISNFSVAGFGDVAQLPGAPLKNPQGIRSMEEWIIAHKLMPEYIHGVFAYQLEVGLKNLEILKQAVGDKICTIVMGGTDFGTQHSLMMSREDFREFYLPYWKKANDWVHKNTNWKTFYHSCGAISELIPDFIEAGADILNPVQCSAAGMDPATLKKNYGDKLVFWGGGMDTQKTLPFGKPEEVRQMVFDRTEIFGKDGGFIFNPIHNVQGNTPVGNLTAMIDALDELRGF